MTTATATYDADADAIAIRFRPEGSQYVESQEVAPGIVLDFDAQGRVIGVELLYVRDMLASGSAGAYPTTSAKPAAA
jgi:uncharacterized protein YuzE